MGEPWVKVKVGLVKSDKVAGLPNGDARWGWVKALAEAKLQRRMGVFASRRHLADLLGPEGRYVRDYVRVGLAHDVPEADEAWPENCTDRRCDRYYREDTTPGEVVIHDFRLEQRDPTNADRQERFSNARRNGAPNAPSNAPVTGRSRALSPSLTPSLSPSLTGDEPYQVADEGPEGPVLSWLAARRIGIVPDGRGFHRKLVLLVERHGAERVTEALSSVIDGGAKGERAVIFGAENVLDPVPSANGASQKPRKGYMARQEDLDALAR